MERRQLIIGRHFIMLTEDSVGKTGADHLFNVAAVAGRQESQVVFRTFELEGEIIGQLDAIFIVGVESLRVVEIVQELLLVLRPDRRGLTADGQSYEVDRLIGHSEELFGHQVSITKVSSSANWAGHTDEPVVSVVLFGQECADGADDVVQHIAFAAIVGCVLGRVAAHHQTHVVFDAVPVDAAVHFLVGPTLGLFVRLVNSLQQGSAGQVKNGTVLLGLYGIHMSRMFHQIIFYL